VVWIERKRRILRGSTILPDSVGEIDDGRKKNAQKDHVSQQDEGNRRAVWRVSISDRVGRYDVVVRHVQTTRIADLLGALRRRT
jgi:hypothetical protein